jgi:hypothetical protein
MSMIVSPTEVRLSLRWRIWARARRSTPRSCAQFKPLADGFRAVLGGRVTEVDRCHQAQLHVLDAGVDRPGDQGPAVVIGADDRRR